MLGRIHNHAIPKGVKLLLLVLVLSIWSIQALALGVGQPQESSYINRPLTLKLPLQGSVDDLLGATFQHASADEYKMLGLERNEIHQGLQFKAVINSAASYLMVETSQSISDLTLSFVVAVTGERTGRMLRDVHVLLDPPSQSEKAFPATNATADKAVKSGRKNAEYGPVPAGSMLSSIAASTKPRHLSVGKAIALIYRANPEAFINGDIDRLKSGVMLSLPYLQVPTKVGKEQKRQSTTAQVATPGDRPKIAVQQPVTSVSYDSMGVNSAAQVRPSGNELELVNPSQEQGITAASDFNAIVLAKLNKIESLNVALLGRIAELETKVKSQADYIDQLRSMYPQAVATASKPASKETTTTPASVAVEPAQVVQTPTKPTQAIAANLVAANSQPEPIKTTSQEQEVVTSEEGSLIGEQAVSDNTALPEEATASGHWKMPTVESGGLLPWLVMGVVAFVLMFLFVYRYRDLWLGGIRSAWAVAPSVEIPEWRKGEWNHMVGGGTLRDKVAEAFSWRSSNEVHQREEYADASAFLEPSAQTMDDSAMPESEMATHLMRVDYPEHDLPGQEDALAMTEMDLPEVSNKMEEQGLYGGYGPEDSYLKDADGEETIHQRFERGVDEDTEIVDFNLEEDGLIDELKADYQEAEVLESRQNEFSEYKSRNEKSIDPDAISEDELAEVGGFVDKVEESLKETEGLADYPAAPDVEGDIAAIDEDSSGMLLDEHELTELLSYYKVNETQLRKQTDFVDDADNGYQLLLDLAASYIGTSDFDTARDLLHETMEFGTGEQKEIAKELLAELPEAEKKNSSKNEAGSLKLVG